MRCKRCAAIRAFAIIFNNFRIRRERLQPEMNSIPCRRTMPNSPFQSDEHSDDELPPRLKDDLAAVYGPAIQVPASIDRLILSAVGAGIARRRRSHRIIRWAGAAAAAAALAIGLRVALVRPSATSGPVALVGDVNGDGKVDILDAYVVARAIHDHGRLNPAWDVNRDGVVDEKDVDWIVNSSVSIGPGGAK